MNFKEKIKLRLANWIDDSCSEACWANLVMWVFGYYTTIDTFWYGEWKNKECNKKSGYYCGKCKINIVCD